MKLTAVQGVVLFIIVMDMMVELTNPIHAEDLEPITIESLCEIVVSIAVARVKGGHKNQTF